MTEADINRIAIQVIEERLGVVYAYSSDTDGADHTRLVTLGEISGILNMASAVKR